MRTCHFRTLLGLLAVIGTSGIAGTFFAASSVSTPPAAEVPLRAESILRAADLRADVAVLRRAYTTLHPGLYRYNTPAQMEAAFRALEAEFKRDRTLADAYLAFSVFAAKVKCGHTYASFFNQKKAVREALFQGGRVPFNFRWLNQRMIVTQSFPNDPRLQPGTEVLAINGTPTATILKRLMTVARADGSNDAKRVAYLEVQGTSRLEAFDIYFPMFFPSSAQLMTLRVRGLKEKRLRSFDVKPLTFEERLAAMRAADTAADIDAPAWKFRQLDERIAYLRMPSWALYNSKWNWRAFLSESFETLVRSGATDLLIDLRGNEGGLDVGDEIVSHYLSY